MLHKGLHICYCLYDTGILYFNRLIANLDLQINNFELCQQTCGTLLQLDADNEDGAVMMANIAFQKVRSQEKLVRHNP